MHTIILKADDRLYQQIALMAEELQLSKSDLIKQAFFSYQEIRSKNNIKRMLQEASLKVRKTDVSIIKILDELTFDGLIDD